MDQKTEMKNKRIPRKKFLPGDYLVPASHIPHETRRDNCLYINKIKKSK